MSKDNESVKRMPVRPKINNKILLVDDDIDILVSIKAILDFEGFSVTCATNGAEALIFLKSMEPSLIILDLMMPVMDGIEFFRELQNHRDLRDIPVVIVTALANPKPIPGIKKCLKKPLGVEPLLEVAREFCIPEVTKGTEA